MEWILPIKTISEANSSEHWTKKKKRHDIQKVHIRLWWLNEKPEIQLPCKIKLTRLSSRLLDDDNLVMAFKWIRDTIAGEIFPSKAPGHADNDARLTWEYGQQKGKEKAIKIEIFSENQLLSA
jgi:hypothetical protein